MGTFPLPSLRRCESVSRPLNTCVFLLRNHNLNQYNDIAELLYALIAFDIY